MKKINRRKFLENSTLLTASTFVLGAAGIPAITWKGNSFDIVISNGLIIDGTGLKEFRADIGIKEGKILALENLKSASADRIIDATGLKVTPGFIDIHTHTDLGVLSNPNGESKVRQGITLEISGNCGESFAPVNPEKLSEINERFEEKYGTTAANNSMGAFLNMLSGQKFSVNQATLLGLGTIREICVGMDDRPATVDEMRRMKYEIQKAIEEGAFGLASGLEYTPGSFASTEELIEVCGSVPQGKTKLYATHMRNEDDFGEEAVDEAIKIALESGCRLQMSHLKASGKSNWHKAESLLNKMDEAVKNGLEVHADRYTYVAYHTGLGNLFPLWARDGGNESFIQRLQNDSLLIEMRKYSDKKAMNLDGDWAGVVISGINNTDYQIFKGKSIKEISQQLGKDPFDTAVDLLINSSADVSMVGFGMNEKSTEKILSHPRVMIASDAGAHAPYPPMNSRIAHPRAYGTFPRAIGKYVRERNICSLEEMIKKMTSMPADKLFIKNRGRIKQNNFADITIFDFNTIEDRATFLDPHQYPKGIPYVIVNGKVVIDEGRHTGERPGVLLRS